MARLEELKDAYARGVLELEEFEDAVGAVLAGEGCPAAVERKLYSDLLTWTDKPGQIITYTPPSKRHWAMHAADGTPMIEYL